MQPKIYVALTTHRSIVDSGCTASLADLFYYFGVNKIEAILRVADAADIANARDYLVGEMLRGKGFTHILFVDSDMVFPSRLVTALIDAKRDVIGYAYPQRFIDKNGAPVGFVPDAIKPGDFDSSEPTEITHIGMGLCLISREAFESLIATGKIATMPIAGSLCARFFDRLKINGTTAGEDVSFCHRWRDLCGGKVYAVASREIAHVGRVEIKARASS